MTDNFNERLQTMKPIAQLVGVAGTVLLGLFGATSFGQTPLTYRYLCQSIGTGPQEPLGDRDGHNISVYSYSCRVEGGPLDGGVVTGNAIYEWNQTIAAGLTGNGVVRKPGAVAVFELSDFKNALTVVDGKVTGFSAAGHGTYKLATGTAVSLAGRTYTYTGRPNGPGQFAVDIKVD
jgi:hypothetical protein